MLSALTLRQLVSLHTRSLSQLGRSPLSSRLLPACTGVVLALVITTQALALPGGFDPAQSTGVDTVTYPTPNSQLITTVTPRSIGSFNTFNIAASESVHVNQLAGPNSMFTAVVRSGSPTTIYGSLTSNASVGIVNPGGVYIGPSGSVNVAGGFLATTQRINEAQFLGGGGFSFTDAGTNPYASITNDGNITVGDNTFVTLIGPKVVNNGTITGQGAQVTLASAKTFSMVTPDGVNIKLDVGSTKVANNSFKDGSVFTGIVNNTGRIEANAVTTNEFGDIVLVANRGEVKNSGELLANAADAGTSGGIELQGETFEQSSTGSMETTGTIAGEIRRDVTLAGTTTGDTVDINSKGQFTVDGDVTGTSLVDLSTERDLTTSFASGGPVSVLSGSTIQGDTINLTSGGKLGDIRVLVEDGATVSAGTAANLNAMEDVVVEGLVESGGSIALNATGAAGLVKIGSTGRVIAEGDITSSTVNHDIQVLGEVLSTGTAGGPSTISFDSADEFFNSGTIRNLNGNVVIDAENNIYNTNNLGAGDIWASGDLAVLSNQDGINFGNIYNTGSLVSTGGNILLSAVDQYHFGTVYTPNTVTVETGVGNPTRGYIYQEGFFAGDTLALNLVGGAPNPETAAGDSSTGFGGGRFESADFRVVTGSSNGSLNYNDVDGVTVDGLTMASGTNAKIQTFVPTGEPTPVVSESPEFIAIPDSQIDGTQLSSPGSEFIVASASVSAASSSPAVSTNGNAENELLVTGEGISGGNALELFAADNPNFSSNSVATAIGSGGNSPVISTSPGTTATNNGIRIDGPITVENLFAADVKLSGAPLTVTTNGGVTVTEENGTAFLRADTVAINGPVTTSSDTGLVILAPTTDGTSIGLGGGSGSFNVTQAEFDQLNGADLFVGYTPNTEITVSQPSPAAKRQNVAEVEAGYNKRAFTERIPNTAFDPLEVFTQGTSTNGPIEVGLVDLSNKPNSSLTLNTTGAVTDSTPTVDDLTNINLGTNGILSITGGASTVANSLSSTPGVGTVGSASPTAPLGDLDVTVNGAIPTTSFVAVNRNGGVLAGNSINDATNGVFVNVPIPTAASVTTASFLASDIQGDGDESVFINTLGRRFQRTDATTITNTINNSTITLEGELNEANTPTTGLPVGANPGIGIPSAFGSL